MPNFLVIKTTDVTGAPVSATVMVQFGTDAAPRRTKSSSTPGSLEISIPPDQVKAIIFVSAPGLFDAQQAVKFQTASLGALEPPQLDFDGAQEINTKLLTISSRGNQYNHEVHLVLGQLRDATAKVDRVLRSMKFIPRDDGQPNTGIGLSLALPNQSIRDVQTPILNPAGSGASLFNAVGKAIPIASPNGPVVFVAERQGTPQLIAIVHPGFANPSPGQKVVPLPYHVFFSPRIPDDFGPDYPFGLEYAEFIDRYLILQPGDDSSPRKKLALAYQNLVAGAQNILVLPVAQGLLPQSQQMGDLTTQAATLRLLQEVNFWVQRMRGVSVPLQPVGPVALSCYSSGVRFLSQVVRSTKVPEFFDSLLRHVYLLDPWFDGAAGQSDAVKLGQSLLKWHRAGNAFRTLRVYTQFNVWQPVFDAPFRALPGASVVSGPAGSKEIDAPAATLLFAPLPFWFLVDPTIDPKNNPAVSRALASAAVHDVFPARFLSHAVKNSQFSP